ncbi:nuclear transport factor 2 family protein [Candidatus Xianfuyuplasma coldseepsis]|uniref:Nuclear transport factor 2 family protein n=1 Tax=Candidatus Xianfuyuplasma coldseepsis TaxID=2782163 RepID=A0A7L7KR71_9MOLU|nr:nuclear transport factor 2 family protein [Xianfuyuplasma coldseepsis]QMS85223.1 nuclear transport factor 2 family protein [Xianfuyuplasma coldseepsis]
MNDIPTLTEATIKEYWSKTYNKDGKPDWSHIFPFYHEDIRFQDSIQVVEGFDNFEKMCNRLTKRTKSLEMDLLNINKNDNVILMEWIMTMSFRRSPKTRMYGTTRLTLHEDGRIIEQRDYYDLWGDIFDNVPVWRRIYRWFMRTFFG